MNRLLEKLIPLSLLTLSVGYNLLNAQVVVVKGEHEKPLPKTQNEIRLNLFTPVLYKAISLEYERIILKDLSAGTSVNASLEGGTNLNMGLFPTLGAMPYVRWYFGGSTLSLTRANAGFFIEANTGISYNTLLSGHHNSDTKGWISESKGRLIWGIGLGGGWKFVSRSNWSGEISVRMGRSNLLLNSEKDLPYIYPTISVGYRF